MVVPWVATALVVGDFTEGALVGRGGRATPPTFAEREE